MRFMLGPSLARLAGYKPADVRRVLVTRRGEDRIGQAGVDITTWLHGLGLKQYEQAFRESENAIDAETPRELTAGWTSDNP
jgi:hypothetical protein